MDRVGSDSQSSLSEPSDADSNGSAPANVTSNKEMSAGMDTAQSRDTLSKSTLDRSVKPSMTFDAEKEDPLYKNVLPPSTIICLTYNESRLDECEYFEPVKPTTLERVQIPSFRASSDTDILGKVSRRTGKEADLPKDHFIQLHKGPEQKEKQAKKFELERLRQERNKLKADIDKLLNVHVAERTIKSIIGESSDDHKESKEDLESRKSKVLIDMQETLKRYDDVLRRSKKSAPTIHVIDTPAAVSSEAASASKSSVRRKRESAIIARQSLSTRKNKSTRARTIDNGDEVDELESQEEEQVVEQRPKKKSRATSSASTETINRKYPVTDPSVVLERPYYQTIPQSSVPSQHQRHAGIPVHVPAGPYPPGMIPPHYYTAQRLPTSQNPAAYAWGTKLPDFHDIRREFELDPWTPEFRQVYYLYGQENVTLRKLLNDRKKKLLKQAEKGGKLLSPKVKELVQRIAPVDSRATKGFDLHSFPTYHSFRPPSKGECTNSQTSRSTSEKSSKKNGHRNGFRAATATTGNINSSSLNGGGKMHMYTFGRSKAGESDVPEPEIDLHDIDQMDFS